MSYQPYFFGVRSGRAARAAMRHGCALDRIARAHGARFVVMFEPTGTPRAWFETRNYGFPFDAATARAVFDAVHAAGYDY